MFKLVFSFLFLFLASSTPSFSIDSAAKREPMEITIPVDQVMYDATENAIILPTLTESGEFLAFAQLWDSLYVKPTKVFMDGPGGSFKEAINIGIFIHDHHLDTYAGKSCVSSCAYMWLAGNNKFAIWASEIAIHAPYNPSTKKADYSDLALAGWYIGKIGAPGLISVDIAQSYMQNGIDVFSVMKYFASSEDSVNEDPFAKMLVSYYNPKKFSRWELPFLDIYTEQDQNHADGN